ncbi:acyl carrier protein [Mycoplasma sp. SG1]|uniref:acyl carrier protein n=1 Tax=Mycoplasma sp. SG1 TaxID=2810348 RepID=UPI00202542B6|nr:acyl carrier protein [Mycoplasma sp. SG1]URM53241.1 acyl carrier protein [Mycoplasma sp. SG1]
MKKNEIEKQVLEILKKLDVDPKLLTDDIPIKESELDSLKLFEIIIEIENAMNIRFNTNDLYKIKTFNSFIELIYKTKK